MTIAQVARAGISLDQCLAAALGRARRRAQAGDLRRAIDKARLFRRGGHLAGADLRAIEGWHAGSPGAVGARSIWLQAGAFTARVAVDQSAGGGVMVNDCRLTLESRAMKPHLV